MTDLEERLRDLIVPTDAGAPAPSLQRVQLDAAARRHRHRSGRILAAAAIVVVVLGLAVAVVRRPQPTTVDALGGPGTTATTVPTTWCLVDLGLTRPSISADEGCPHPPDNVVSLSVAAEDNLAPDAIDQVVSTIRLRLEGVGLVGATVAQDGTEIRVYFGDHPLQDVSAMKLVMEDLPVKFMWTITGDPSTADTQP